MKKQLLLFALLASCSHLSAMIVQQQQTNIADLPQDCLQFIFQKVFPQAKKKFSLQEKFAGKYPIQVEEYEEIDQDQIDAQRSLRLMCKAFNHSIKNLDSLHIDFIGNRNLQNFLKDTSNPQAKLKLRSIALYGMDFKKYSAAELSSQCPHIRDIALYWFTTVSKTALINLIQDLHFLESLKLHLNSLLL